MVPLLAEESQRRGALRSLWIAGERMGKSMDLIQFAGAEQGGWEKEMLRYLQDEVSDSVVAILKTTPPEEVRVQALETLGSFRRISDLRWLEESLLSPSLPVRIAAIHGLSAYRGNFETAEILLRHWLKLTPDADEREARLTAFAMGEVMMLWQPSRIHQDANEAASDLMQQFAEHLIAFPLRTRCVGVEGIRKTRLPSTASPLFTLFDATPKGTECTGESDERPPLSPPTLSVTGDFQYRILDALSLMALGNEEIIDWARDRVRAPDRESRCSAAVVSALESLIRQATK